MTHAERIDRLERVVQLIAEDQFSLQKIVADLATETRRAFDHLAEQGAETDRRMRETDEHMRETDRRMRDNDKRIAERFVQTDERIGKLVIAIGEFMRRQ